MPKTTEEPLIRGLNLTTAASIVVGIVIGSGIFIGANRVAQGVTAPWMVFAVWIGAGLLTLLGAFTYAEFGSAFPKSGGDYVYIRKSLSPFWGFLTGWATFWLNLPFSIGALALAFASQLESLKGANPGVFLFDGFAIRFTAVAIIAIFTFVNIVGVRSGGGAQRYLTGMKLLLIAVLIAFGLSTFSDNLSNLDPFFTASKAAIGGPFAGFALALVGALWAYDGWSGVTRVAAEVENPSKNLPKALAFGILAVIGVYVLVNLAYLLALGLDGFAGATGDPTQDRLVGTRAATQLLGSGGSTFTAVLIMVSVLGALNGLTLSGPRVYYAMARDRLFPQVLAKVHPVHKTPHNSIIAQGVFSSVLVLFLTFEQLTAFVVLAAWFQYALVGIGLIILRRRQPDLERPYKVPLYPWVPGAFFVLSTAFVLYLVVDITAGFFAGDVATFVVLVMNLAILGLAVPAYRHFRARLGQPTS